LVEHFTFSGFETRIVYFSSPLPDKLLCTEDKKEIPWLWSASELCRPSDRRLLAK
jgi:hypothetical protein